MDLRVAYSVIVTKTTSHECRLDDEENHRYTFATREQAQGFMDSIQTGSNDPIYWSSRTFVSKRLEDVWIKPSAVCSRFQMVTFSELTDFDEWPRREDIRKRALEKLTEEEKIVLGLLSKK